MPQVNESTLRQGLVESEEFALDNQKWMRFGNWNWDPQTKSFSWSHGMYWLMDLDPDKPIAEITMDFYCRHIVEEDREKITKAFDHAELNKNAMIEFSHRVVTHHQSEKTLCSRGRIIYDHYGKIRSILGTTRDITEHTDLVNNLNHCNQVVRERERFLGHGSWEFDLQNKNTTWSDGMFHLFGYDPDQNKPPNAIEDFYKIHLSPETFEKARVKLIETLKKGDKDYALSYEIKSLGGETKMLESFGKVIRNRLGKGVRVLGATRDVTQLRRYEHDLRQKISELDRLSKELEDSAYAASHDLQEPLRKISTLSDRLQSKFNEVLPEDGKKYIERIQVATRNARMLIDSLLEFSRITHETQTFKETDLNILLHEVMADLELKIEETHTTIHVGKLPTLEVSNLQVKQLFSNIILNSIKFRKADVLSVVDIQSRNLEKSEIENYYLDTGIPHVLITVQDNGIGLEEGNATKIFQMFSRLHGKSEYSGAGIGLALCKKIVESHKGRIFARGIPDQGAVFSIILPKEQI